MPSLTEYARQIAADAETLDPIRYGPWAGSMRSKTADKVPREYIATGSDFHYVPRTGHFRRRLGQVQKFDSFASPVGMLPAKWGGRCRWIDEFKSTALASDGVPTLMGLVTKETITAGIDDGRFSNLWIRDQVANANYTFGSEYSSATYPTLGSHQSFKVTPLWYDSGDGGIVRGTSEFLRRFYFSGSRRNRKVGNWLYHPSLNATPSRCTGERASAGAGALQASSNVTAANSQWEAVNCAEEWQGILTSDDATAYMSRSELVGSFNHRMGLGGTISASDTSWTITYRARRTGALDAAVAVQFSISRSDGQQFTSASILPQSAWTTSWADYTATVSGAAGATGQVANSIVVTLLSGTSGGNRADITYLAIGSGTAGYSNRLMPTGPFPPLHSGTAARGTMVSDGGAALMVPDADTIPGAWTSSGASLFSVIDEASLDTTDRISSTLAGANCTLRLSDPVDTPTVSDEVSLTITVQSLANGTDRAAYIYVELLEFVSAAYVVRYAATVAAPGSTASVTHTLPLSSAQIQSVTNWTNMFVRLYVGGTSASTGYVSRFAVAVRNLSIQTQGGWKGSDRFYWACAYQFEDDSIWMQCDPRPPSSLLPNGFNLFTVDIANPDASYASVLYTNLPKRPYGCKALVLMRCTKISAVQDDNLQLDPTQLRVIAVIKDATTTSYEDFYGADDSLKLDVAERFIRRDHLMSPRARYIFGGDMRVCVSYGGQSPCAIEIAPVGRTTDYDLNLADDDPTAYTSQGSWMQLGLSTAGVMTLTLIQGDGATATNTSTFGSGTYTTLQQLVDAINATTCTATVTADQQQWRAQVAPGANPDVLMTSLCPHNRAIASCVVAAQTITKSTGGLSKVAVGQWVDGTGVTSGAYITRIDSDTQLTFTGTITAATKTLNFFNNLGDSQITAPATDTQGFQRVICGALPGWLYFSKTQLNRETLDKQSVWMTTASPDATKSAANCFSLKTSNRFNPPDATAGVSQGGGGVDNGFVVPFVGGIYAIRNKRDMGTGEDSDYRIEHINKTRGCPAWATVGTGPGFVHYLTAEGMCAADMGGEMQLSDHTYLHNPQTGDFTYELPLCEKAAAQDVDYSLADSTICAYASARVMRGILLVNYRASGSSPNRQVAYDFSTGNPSVGLAALVDNLGLIDEVAEPRRVIRRPGDPWGWSLPLVRSLTAMCEGVTNASADGKHLYGWNDANAGSTGDGRIDEFETSETDNGTAISGSVGIPIERLGVTTKLSAQKIILEHSSPVGSVGALEFHRGLTDTTYSLTPSTSATDLVRDVKELPQAARGSCDRFYLKYTQTSGSAREVRLMEPWVIALRDSLD